ncbi:MAG: hypothetical protein QUV07_01470 [Cyanobium sp. CZS 25K]|nr:hypothetical protein [Cyanobium sp. CZS25K]
MDQGYGQDRDPRDRETRERDPREPQSREREVLRRPRSGADPLDQRVDRWVNAGRQFVEGVAGSRPGGRPTPRGSERGSSLRPRIDELGRWVEGRLDWLLDDGDDWREPWQEAESGAAGAPSPSASPPVRSRRQGLEAVSRRGRPAAPAPQASGPEDRLRSGTEPGDDGEWPDDASFTLPRWQRPERAERGERSPAPDPAFQPPAGGRPLPRSSRRRP